jgi:tetratricopeptide (TPR) repeat protein
LCAPAFVATEDYLACAPATFVATEDYLNPDSTNLTLYFKVTLTKIQQMLRRMWRRLWGTPPQPSPMRRGSKNEGEILPSSEAVEETLSLSDTYSDEAEVWLNLGKQQWDAGDFLGAIASYNKAATAWNNRGFALYELGQYEQAVASYDKALEIQPDLHKGWNDRGAVLDELGQYEQAVASYDKALEIQPDDHEAWNNRGVALDELGQYEQAVASYDKALDIKPDDHEAWYNRGIALRNLGQYEQAVASYDKALDIKPDFHKAWNDRGIALSNFGQYEEAIASFDKALEIKPDFHKAWNNRGGAAGQSRNYFPQAALRLQMQFPKSPVVKENPTLTERGYEGQLLCLQEGLKHCPQPESQGFLHQAIGETHYIQGKEKPNYRTYWRQAVNKYRQALSILTPEAFPELHLEVVQKLIKVLFGLGEDAEAKQWRRQGLKVLLQQFNTKTTSAQKRQLVAKYSGLSQMRVEALVEDGNLALALEWAELNKNLRLTGILDAQKQHIFSPSYQEIQQLLNPTTAIIYWHLSEYTLTTFMIKPGAEEPIVIEEPLPSLKKFDNWVKNWDEQYQQYPSSKKINPALRSRENESQNSWRDNLPEMLANLSQILNISGILSELTNINQLILIPHRDLHRFPIHALFPNTFTITYLPSVQIGLTLSNSSLNQENWGGNILSIEHPDSQDLNPLPYAEIESAAISQIFKNSKTTRISGQNATKEAVINTLKDSYQTFHFTGHGAYTSERSKQPALYLSGTDCLTIEDIRNLSLNNYQLITLAACETGITDRETIKEEYVGLVSAFLYQQVSHVVTTLWTIPERESSLLMIYFYWQLKKGKTPNIALAKSIKWLRNLTDGKLARLYKIIVAQLPKSEKALHEFIENELEYRIPKLTSAEKHKKRFDHPYYWAAFTITGKIN